MALDMTRRDFMKCAGVTVLAVAAGGLLAGCSDSEGDTTVNGTGKTATVGGIKITVSELIQLPASIRIAGITAGADNAVYVYPKLKIENASGTPVSIVRTNFVTKVDGRKLEAEAGSAGSYLVALAKGYNTMDLNGIAIQNGDVRNGVLCYTFPKDWKKLELTFYTKANATGDKVTFVLTNPDNK